ncbi:ParA family protein [Ilyobacter sp.]|uniref:ParA family protein n=1 Tax=Ilyobacter sp. TaxID=3100343 RepID=UPI003564B2EE
MKIISLLNQKGGVGTSTTAVNLSVALSKLNKKVLLIDLDPQGDTTDYSGVIDEQENTSLEFLLEGNKKVMTLEHYDLIPADISLSDFELRAVNMIARESILRSKMDSVEGYDYCLIDCPPSLGLLSVNSLVASNLVISPVLLERFSIKGLRSLSDTLENIKVINPNIENKFLVNKYNKSYSHNTENFDAIMEVIKEQIFKTVVRQDVKISQSQVETTNIFDFDKKSKAAIDFKKLAEEVIRLG